FAPGTGPPPCLLPRAPHPPDRFASRPRPLASRDHSHPASQGTLPRQLVRQWAFVPYLAPTRQAPSTSLYSPQAPSAPTGLAVGHPRSIRPGTRPPPDRPVPFRSGAHPPPDLLPQAPCPPGGAPPSPATPAPGPHEGAWAGEGSRGKNPGCRLPRRHPQVAPRWPTGPAPGQTAKPPVRPGEWVPLRPTGSGFRQRRRTPKTPRRGSRKPEEGTVVSATRLLDRVHDPLGHFSRLQRIHPRAR
ncbi:hypothetical protein P170DRAFT_514699, partial [Aspergillus steynii IBT 23096]